MIVTRRAGLAALALALLLASLESSAAERVRYNMAWLPQGSQAGVFVALEQGYYAAEGLEVSIFRGYGGVRTVNEIDQGLFEFGYGDPMAVLLNRSKRGSARLIGAVNHHYPGGLCFIAERGLLRKPAELVGRRVGGGVGSPIQILLPAWLRANAVDPAGVRLLQMDPAVIDAALIQGQIDAAECWLASNKATLEWLAQQAHLTLGWLEYRRFGPDVYGSGIVTSDALLRARPAVVRAFLRATYRGYAAARREPALAVTAILQRFPGVQRSVIEQQVREIVSQLPAGDAPVLLARFDLARMAASRDYYVKTLGIDPAPDSRDYYANPLEN